MLGSSDERKIPHPPLEGNGLKVSKRNSQSNFKTSSYQPANTSVPHLVFLEQIRLIVRGIDKIPVNSRIQSPSATTKSAATREIAAQPHREFFLEVNSISGFAGSSQSQDTKPTPINQPKQPPNKRRFDVTEDLLGYQARQ